MYFKVRETKSFPLNTILDLDPSCTVNKRFFLWATEIQADLDTCFPLDALQGSCAPPLSGLRLVPKGQAGEQAPGREHQSHHLAVQRHHQPRGQHHPGEQRARNTAKRQDCGEVDSHCTCKASVGDCSMFLVRLPWSCEGRGGLYVLGQAREQLSCRSFWFGPTVSVTAGAVLPFLSSQLWFRYILISMQQSNGHELCAPKFACSDPCL